MRNKLRSDDLDAFVAAAQALNFRSAADSLALSPSALSRRIQRIEEQLDVRLFERTTREVRLTLPGKQMLARSRQILSEIEELTTAVKGRRGGRSELVKIAVIPSVAYLLLPECLRGFHARFPSTRVLVRDLTTNEVVEAVSRGDADFGVTSFVQPDGGLSFQPLIRGSFVLAMAPDHALSKRRRVRWSELRDHRVISTWRGSGVRLVMDFDLARAAERLEPFYEVQHVFTALAFAAEGLGVAPAPDHFVSAQARRRLALRPLVDPVVPIDIGVVLSRARGLRPPARAMLELLQAQAQAQAAAAPGA